MKKGQPTHMIYEFDNLYDGVVKQAQRYGDRDRYIYKVNKEERHFTFRDMLAHVNYISSAMASLGVAGKFVGVTGDTHPDYVATYIATVACGGVIVPLDKDISPEQLVGFVDMCDIELLVYTHSLHKKILEAYEQMKSVRYFVCIDFDGESLPQNERFLTFEKFFEIGREAYEAGDRTAENQIVDKEKLCTILFTSGTTGTSKGVMLNQRNLITATMDSVSIMATTEKDFFVSVLPIHHSYEFTCEQLALPNTGATTFINDSIKNTLRNFAHYKPTALVLVPLYVETMHKKIWAEIEKKGKAGLIRRLLPVAKRLPRKVRRAMFREIIDAFGGRLDYIVCGGAPLRSEVMADFDAFGIKICEGYGITECAPLISANPMHWRKYHSVGLKVPHMEVRIEKADPDDETGEILAHGDAVMLGYYKNPVATAEAFTEDGWFKTGDIGYIDEDNFIFITGRKKNVIIASNGKNVFPEEIEEYLSASELISECVVLGRKSGDENDVIITALIYPDFEKFEGKTGEEIQAAIEAEIDEVNKKLPTFKHIKCVEIRDTEFEKTTSRKIIRYKLK